MNAIAVAGATGTVGRQVAAELRRRGHEVVSLSRADGVDVRAGAGLERALDGCSAVVDVLNTAGRSTAAAVDFFTATTANLLAACGAVGVGHHVALSIVGIEAAPTGYYAGKLRQEELVRAGQVPWTIVRTTQFHDFAGQLLAGLSLGPLAPMPIARLRPVATGEVAALLADAATGEPRRATVQLRGPQQESLVAMARRTVAARGGRRLVLPLPLPGALGRAMRGGALCGDDSARAGTVTFAEWLTSVEEGKTP